MPGWQDTFDALTGERYPGLIAYALLYTGDASQAQQLVDGALRTVLRRGRKFPAADAAHALVRHEVASAFVREQPRSAVGSAAGAAEAAAESSDGASADALDAPETSPFAPPSADATPAEVYSQTTDYLPAEDAQEPRSVDTEDTALASSLASLEGRTRAVVILHHFDGYAVRRIEELTGMRAAEVAARLAEGGTEVGRRTGVAVASAAPDDVLAHVELTVAIEPTTGRRRA